MSKYVELAVMEKVTREQQAGANRRDLLAEGGGHATPVSAGSSPRP